MIQKFRAWDKKCNEMFKDTFAVTENGQVIIVEQESVFDTPDYMFTDDLIIMQSTGLKDKNGKEIFEGDVVKYEVGRNTYTEEVAYDKNLAGFGVKDAKANVVFTFGEIAEDISLISLEVIGNIYEDSELLKGGA